MSDKKVRKPTKEEAKAIQQSALDAIDNVTGTDAKKVRAAQSPKQRVNIAERMSDITAWLESQDENLSFGLRSIVDAEKLYDYFTSDESPDRYADGSDEKVRDARVGVLGYDPLA
jgi:hypothetical protein